jgi:metal-responsive CopG/Arc/MetJ family transcriptional regulator
MDPNRNEDEESATSLRSSIYFPPWMTRRLDAIAQKTLSSRSQVIRRLVAEGLEREPVEGAA